MGLDGVMIILETEKAFGLTISNADAARMHTPGDLVSYVAARVPLDPEPACLSLATFSILRQALVQVTGQPRHAFAPRTRISEFTTPQAWPRLWADVQQVARSWDWPDIQWTRFIYRTPPTLRAVVESILIDRFARQRPLGKRWTRSEVEFTIRRIILFETGRDNYSLSASLVKDLGVT